MYSPDEIILPKAIFLTWRHVLTLTRVATVSVPIVAETCARRGAGFSRFLQLVPGEGESQTTGKLCVLHFLYKVSLTSRVFAMDERSKKWGAMRNLESGDRIERSTKILRKRQFARPLTV